MDAIDQWTPPEVSNLTITTNFITLWFGRCCKSIFQVASLVRIKKAILFTMSLLETLTSKVSIIHLNEFDISLCHFPRASSLSNTRGCHEAKDSPGRVFQQVPQ